MLLLSIDKRERERENNRVGCISLLGIMKEIQKIAIFLLVLIVLSFVGKIIIVNLVEILIFMFLRAL